MIWLYLLLLGFILYVTVRHSVSRVTSTPWQLLWLVLMIPFFILGFWRLTQAGQPIPPEWLVGSFIFSAALYVLLLQRHRRVPPQHSSQAGTSSPPKPPVQSLQPKVAPLTKGEESQLQTCFPWSVYYLQHIDYRPQSVVCRGHLRSQPEVAYQTIQDNIEAQFGDRFLLLFQEGNTNKPFFALVPNPERQGNARRERPPLTRPVLALSLLLATLLTTTLVGVAMANQDVNREILMQNPAILLLGLPYAIALIVILGTHEFGHYLTARRYQIKTTLPYFIPIPIPFPFALGTLGAFIQIKSPVPDRKALFDVGIAGPIAGFVITLPLMIWGLMHSEVVPLTDKPEWLSALNPSFSILFALLSKGVMGADLTLDQGIHLHPVAVAGCLGLLITALNLMPVGQLDGGHIVHAMFGQRTGAIIGQVSRILVLLLCLIQPLLHFWAIILIFLPATDEPALNDVSELNHSRDILGLAALGVLLLIILPVPHSLAHVLFATNPVP